MKNWGLKLHWFKHYNTASEGNSLRLLWDSNDFEAYGLWWRLLELVSRWEKPEERGKITLSWNLLARETKWKPSKCRRVLSRISSVSQIELNEKPDGTFSFLVPNWSEYQENRGSKNSLKKVEKPDRAKTLEVRSKKEIKRENTASTPNGVSQVTQIRDCFIEAYKKEFQKNYPGWGAKENAQAKSWLRSISIDQALEYCRHYPKWNDPWISRNGHPFGILVSQYVKLDAWSHRPESVIKKMAAGRVAEKNARVLTEEEERLEAMKAYARRDNPELHTGQATPLIDDFRNGQQSGGVISDWSEAGIPEERSESYDEYFSPHPAGGEDSA